MAHTARGLLAASLLLFTVFPAALGDPPARADRTTTVPLKPVPVPNAIGTMLSLPPAVTAIQAGGSPYMMSFVSMTLSGIASLDSVRNPAVTPAVAYACRLMRQHAAFQMSGNAITLVGTGFLHAQSNSTEISCRFSASFERLERDGTWKVYSLPAPDPVSFTPDRRVVITDTQRLRDWLKPDIDNLRSLGNAGCRVDARDGKLAFRIAAHALANKCTVVLMHLSGNEFFDKDRMPEGIVIGSFKWRVEQVNGDACGFCPGHNACDLPDLVSIGPFRPDDMDTHITEGVTDGSEYSLFTGPPDVNATTRVVGRQQVTFSSSEVNHWHSYVYPMSGALVCRGWDASSVSNGVNNIGGAVGNLAHGQAPSVPPAPEGWLILDEVVLYEPPHTTFP